MSLQTLDAVVVRGGVPRVDLLPPEVRQLRSFRRLRTGLAAGMLGVLGIAAGACAVTAGHVTTAADALAAERARTAVLQAAQAPYAEVPQLVAELEAVQRVRADVSAYDVPLYAYLDALASAAPEGLSLTSLNLSIAPPALAAAAPAPVADPAAAVPPATTGTAAPAAAAPVPGANPLATPGIGVLTVSGQTHSHGHVASWLERVATVPGLADPTVGSSTLDPTTGVVTFSSTATLTDAALRFTR